MGLIKVPAEGALRSYVRTPEHGRAVASWVSDSCSVEVSYDAEQSGWVHEGDARVVTSAIEELGRRALYQRLVFDKASPIVIGAIRNRVVRLRAGTPALSITTKPDIFKVAKFEKPTSVTVWVVGLPPNAYAFSEAACEMHGLLERFTVTVWRPTARTELFEDDDSRHAFADKHGIASLSRLRNDGTVAMFGTAESIACATEDLGKTGMVVRKAKTTPSV